MFYPSPIQVQGGDGVSARKAAAAESAAQEARLQAELLRHDVERLLMITEALWDILREKHGCTEEELLRRVADIDLRDGRLDGRVAPSGPVDCPSCGRKTQPRRPLCLFCGKPLDRDLFAR